jgi:N-acetyl-gamma-glutamyl-phosphate reductase
VSVRPKVAVVGASGFGGTELLRLLARHGGLELGIAAAASSAGRPRAALAPNLPAALGGAEPFAEVSVRDLAAADVVLLGTPDEASLELVPELLAAGARVVDLSGAFRLAAADYATWYRRPHEAPDLALDGATPAVYGLTEHARAAVASAQLVANPGCYPTATLLPLIPVLPLIQRVGIVVSAMSGTSGAGRSTRDDLQASIVHGDVVAYGAPSHRHTAEIETHLVPGGLGAPIVFTPHLVPMSRGLLSTISAPLREGVAQADVDAALAAAYGEEAFVHVLPSGTFPRTKAVHGSNACQLSAVVDERNARLLLSSAIDNLGKGAAGQALQNTNVMLGLPEATGLDAIGVYP